MRLISVSVLSVFIVMPALADVRLPVVNVAAAGVSARAAFGESVPVREKSVVVSTKKSETVATASPKKKTVVARAANKTATTIQSAAQKDSGEQIIASAEILSPRRPSADLWARNDTPLRLPSPEEFSVIRSDSELPEESLFDTPKSVMTASVTPHASDTVRANNAEPMSELDAQIAKLTELQRRADNSVEKNNFVASAAPVATKTRNVATRRVATATKPAPISTRDDTVSVSRMVVPMEQDVIVRAVEKSESPRIAATRDDMTKMSPTELRKAFRKTFLSENKHLSTYQIDDRFDVASDMSSSVEGFTSKRDISETGGIRPLEIKIRFRNEDSALSRDNYNLLTEYAGIVLSNPTRAIQVSIPQSVTTNKDDRKLAARRLAIVEQVLRDTGISEQRIMPVLSQRDEDGFVLRVISSDQYETLTQKRRDMFGDTVGKKTYKSMSW